MSRGTVAGLPVAMPVARQLPSIYQGELFLEQFTGGLDDVLAPAVSVLDSLHAYIDPAVTPPDFLGWLGGWVGLHAEEDWPLARRRALVADAAQMFAVRGTARALAHEIELYTGGVARIADPGATFTSTTPSAGGPDAGGLGGNDVTVRVTVEVPAGTVVNRVGLDALVRAAVPAHLPVELDVVEVATSELDETDLAPTGLAPPAVGGGNGHTDDHATAATEGSEG